MIGTRLGPYEITAKLGEGGMGEVYRATDSKLRREVAIKVLPAAFTADPERLARFEREAQILAQLQHQNIAAIFGLEEAASSRALIMELVEGETLAERIGRGPLIVEEALPIARQIAEALEAAHERGIVHRDLKPQNVKLRPDGTVKVLDFGLAKALEPGHGASDPSRSPTLMNSPTMTAAGTQLGVILGTAAYMAPEQARGATVDKRADIWAFGVLLHEMLSGKSLFAGDTVSDTLAGVLKTDIDLAALPASTPHAIRELLRRCLERNAKNRLHDIADARLVIDDVLAGKAAAPAPAATAAPRRAFPLFAAVLGALVLAGLAWWLGRSSTSATVAAAAPRPSFRQLTKLPGGERHPSLSRDGESFVYVKREGGDLDLFVQRVDGSKPIPVTADCDQDDYDPAFSPDGRSIAFHSDCGGGVFVMGATGESRRRVADFGYQPAWSPDGRELAVVTERLESPTSRNSVSELWAIAIDSGAKRRVTEHDAMGPTWSPDGRHIAFWGLRESRFQRDLWMVAADGSNKTVDSARALLDDPALDWAPAFSGDGRWLYFVSTRGGTFNYWRMPIDPASGERRGEPEPLIAPSSWTGPLSLSADGRRIVFEDFNLETEILRAPLDLGRQALAAPPASVFKGSFVLREQKLSPDGEWLIFSNEDLPQELHLVRVDGSGYRQLTEGDRNRQGSFSPDGNWIVFQTTRGENSLAAIHPDGGGWVSLPVGPGRATPTWSPDGSTIAAYDNNKSGILIDVRPGLAAATFQELPPISENLLFWPITWSRDGKLLGGRAARAGQNENIVVRDMATNTYRELPTTGGALEDFSIVFVDERHLVYTDNRTIWLRDVFATESKSIYNSPPGRVLTNISASRDGRWLTWIERADESDIWLMTLDEPNGQAKATR